MIKQLTRNQFTQIKSLEGLTLCCSISGAFWVLLHVWEKKSIPPPSRPPPLCLTRQDSELQLNVALLALFFSLWFQQLLRWSTQDMTKLCHVKFLFKKKKKLSKFLAGPSHCSVVPFDAWPLPCYWPKRGKGR